MDILRGAVADKARRKAMARAHVSFLLLEIGTAGTKPMVVLDIHYD